MPLKAVLFDLDDTLLGNPMDAFLPRYIPSVSRHAAKLIPDREVDFTAALIKATRVMMNNTDPAFTNAEIFWQRVEHETGIDWLSLGALDHMEGYYTAEYETIQEVTYVKTVAVEMINWVQDQGWQVVIATNPLYPRVAIESRLRWADLSVEAYDFALVTHAENMHATKPQVAYYEEILGRIGCEPHEAVMVGDSWGNDIVPTAALGMPNFWIENGQGAVPDVELTQGVGDLGAFFEMLKRKAD